MLATDSARVGRLRARGDDAFAALGSARPRTPARDNSCRISSAPLRPNARLAHTPNHDATTATEVSRCHPPSRRDLLPRAWRDRRPRMAAAAARRAEAPGRGDVTSAADARVRDSIGRWQEQLLQLDRRNRLLYWKESRTSSVEITCDDLDKFLDRLESARGGLSFPLTLRKPRTLGLFDPASPDPEPLTFEPGQIETPLDAERLQSRLGYLRRKDREFTEEQGVNVLFLAAGYLLWEDEEGQKGRAPLVLVPCDLDRASPRDHFYLRKEDDDASPNATLRFKLSKLGLTLPDFDGGSPVADYLDEVSQLVAGRHGWAVEPRLVLDTFQYSKAAMWEDLEGLKQGEVDQPMVRALAGDPDVKQGAISGPSDWFNLHEGDLAGAVLDHHVPDPKTLPLVVKADYSQMQAVGAAAAGLNLVIHGPPGTGKSQTIANIVANFIASGRTVLFVSEKTAALDVVKRRLDECGLGVFCLDMHSERGKKASVYRQLRESLEDARKTATSGFNYTALLAHRQQLNDLVRALHTRRQPLGRSVFQVHGRAAQLRELPDVDFFISNPGALDSVALNQVVMLAARLVPYGVQFGEHTTSRWRPLRVSLSPVGLDDLVLRDAGSVHRAVGALDPLAGELAAWLGVRSPASPVAADRLTPMLETLATAPGVSSAWLDSNALTRLRRIAAERAEAQRRRAGLRVSLSVQLLSPGNLANASALAEHLHAAELAAPKVGNLLGTAGWTAVAVQTSGTLAAAAEAIRGRAELAAATLAVLSNMLGMASPESRAEARSGLELAARIRTLAPIPPGWLDPGAADWRIPQAVAEARKTLADLREVEVPLLAVWEETLLLCATQEMLARYRTDHQSWVARTFGKAFKADQRVLRACLKSPRPLDVNAAATAISDALKLGSLRQHWAAHSAALSDTLGRRFRGPETDWSQVLADLAEVHDLLAHPSSSAFPPVLVTSPPESGLADAIEAALGALRALRDTELTLGPVSDPLGPVDQLVPAATAALPALRQMAALVEELEPQLRQPIYELAALRDLLDRESHLQAYEEEMKRLTPALARDFEGRFNGWETDWKGVDAALQWADAFISTAPAVPSDRLRAHAVTPDVPQAYENWRLRLAAELAAFDAEMTGVSARFDETATPWEAWRKAGFPELREWADGIASEPSGAAAWLRYSEAVRQLEALIGKPSVSRIRATTAASEQIPGIVERRVLQLWLENVYATEPLLRTFAGTDHNLLIAQFRDLDAAMPLAARAEVRKQCFSRYPAHVMTYTNAGEENVLRDQISKQRKQLPVRKLLQRIPGLVSRIKPCMLMSPLAVSQHLARGPIQSENLAFDLVIFDEASQVFPEDAAPAISRAGQVIVVGDEKQLPPTAFFRKLSDDDGTATDDDDEEDGNALQDRASILDVLDARLGRDVSERYLSVHYRSRHEDLVRFSNHSYYDNRLLVFPSPERETEHLGVRDVYVADGRYGSPAPGKNEVEARRVVECVLALMRARPLDESIGVVALSRTQADLIQQLLDEHRRGTDEFDSRFSEEVHEPFFVKNLENVQGDERDHIVFSVGYGPASPGGPVLNRFGPLNSDLGWRRLNVAVSRARMSMTVVRSLRPTDITSTTAGAQALRRYLEYAAAPATAIQAQQAFDPNAVTDSPFEDAVAAALRERGHRVQPQVGVGGYRIDLGIYSVDGTRFDLGVECDGATYHSAPAARDRDWLRQSVLEDLGWAIHRVWSTSWLQNPSAEVERIEAALEVARARRVHASGWTTPVPPPAADDSDVVHDEADGPVDEPAPEHLFARYREASLGGIPIGPELRLETDRTLAPLILQIVDTEGPVHVDLIVERLRLRYGLGRAREEARERVNEALNKLHSKQQILSVEDAFYHLPGRQARPRRPAAGSRRDVTRISLAELEAGILAVLGVVIGPTADELVTETARHFGFGRNGPEIKGSLEDALKQLVDAGRLHAASDGTVRPGRLQ